MFQSFPAHGKNTLKKAGDGRGRPMLPTEMCAGLCYKVPVFCKKKSVFINIIAV